MDTSLSRESQVLLDDMKDINSIQIPLVLFAPILVLLALIFLMQILAIIALIITINPDLAKQRKTWVTPTLKWILRSKAVGLEKKLPLRLPTPRTTPPPYTNLGSSEEAPHLAAKLSVHSAVPSASPFDIKLDPTSDGFPAGGADPNQSSRSVSQYLWDSHNQLMLLEQQHEKSQVRVRHGEDSLGTFDCGMPAGQLCAGQLFRITRCNLPFLNITAGGEPLNVAQSSPTEVLIRLCRLVKRSPCFWNNETREYL
jgi:hypothetical protein